VKALAERNFERILIIKPSSFGDITHALPVLSRLRARYPKAWISWLVATPFVEILDEHEELDEVIPFDRKRFSRLGRNWQVTTEFMGFVRKLRRKRFDLVIDLQGLFRSGFLSWASGAKVRIGFSNAREAAWVFYTHRVRISDMETHAVERNLRVGKFLGFSGAEPSIRLPIKVTARESLEAKLREAGLRDAEPYAVVIPCARWETKNWPLDRFTAIVCQVWDRFRIRSVLLGTPGEAASVAQVKAGSPAETIDLSGRTSVGEMVAAVAGSRVVICNDSGPMHVASAFGRPLVAMFGPTNPVRTGPYGRMEGVVSSRASCSPCYLKKFRQCPYNHRCLVDLSVEQVLGAVEGALASVP